MDFKNNANYIIRGIIIEVAKKILYTRENQGDKLEFCFEEIDELLEKKEFSEEEIIYIWENVGYIIEQYNKQNYSRDEEKTIKLIKRRLGGKKNGGN